MRKLYSLLLIALSVMVSSTAYAANDPTYGSWENGSSATTDREPTRVLRFFRFSDYDANDTTIASGDALVLDNVSDDGITVIRTTSSADSALVAIACVAIPTADTSSTTFRDDRGHRNWGWGVVSGKADANLTAGGNNSPTAGVSFITSGDAGTVTAAMSINDSGAVARGRGGFFMDTVAAGDTSAEVYVQLE